MTNRQTRDRIHRLCARLRRTAEFRAARLVQNRPPHGGRYGQQPAVTQRDGVHSLK